MNEKDKMEMNGEFRQIRCAFIDVKEDIFKLRWYLQKLTLISLTAIGILTILVIYK